MDDRDKRQHDHMVSMVTVVWNASFKSADIGFKLISWGILVGIIRKIGQNYHSLLYGVFQAISVVMFCVPLISLSFHLFYKDPKPHGFKGAGEFIARAIMVAGGIFLLLFASSPYLEMDAIIDALVSARQSTQQAPHNAGH